MRPDEGDEAGNGDGEGGAAAGGTKCQRRSRSWNDPKSHSPNDDGGCYDETLSSGAVTDPA